MHCICTCIFTRIYKQTYNLYYIIHIMSTTYTLIGVARDGLPPDRLKEAITACYQVFSEVQRRSYDSLLKKWQEYDPVRLCAIVNDMRRMQGIQELLLLYCLYMYMHSVYKLIIIYTYNACTYVCVY